MIKVIGCSAFIAVLTFGCLHAAQQELRGVPRIIDGDTIQIGTTKIRLEGIDTPETDQKCLDSTGQPWNCGIEARNRLSEKAGGEPWICRANAMRTVLISIVGW
jgi:endonuclease YncB( thermonuclease family)